MSVLEFLKERLPEKYVLAIISNIEDKSILDEETIGSVSEELETIFDWSNSEEGYIFWANVFESITEGSKLPMIPIRVKWKPNSYLSTETGQFLINVNGSGKDLMIMEDFSVKNKDDNMKILREAHFSFNN